MKEFLEKGCQVVRGDSTMEGLNASHMMFRVPTMYIWSSSVIRFDSHAQLMDICGVCINVGVSDTRDKKYYFCISKQVCFCRLLHLLASHICSVCDLVVFL